MSDRKRAYDDEEGQRFSKRDRRNDKVIKMLCPFYSAGAVIGKGGESIKEIKNETGANIQVSKNDARFPNTDERVISISGDLDSMQKVVLFVQEKIRSDKIPPHVTNINTNQNEARKATCKLVVSDASIGKIIGKGGANINKLKDQFNVKIETMKKDEAVDGLRERMVSIEADNNENVDACVAEIIKDVYEDERAHMDFNVDYQSFGRGEGRGGHEVNDRGGYGNNERSGYGGNDRGGYGSNERSGYGSNERSGYGSNERSGYGNNERSGYGGNERSGYGGRSGGYGGRDSYDSHSSGYPNRGYGGGYGDRSGSNGAQRSGYNNSYNGSGYGASSGRSDSYGNSAYSDSRSGGHY